MNTVFSFLLLNRIFSIGANNNLNSVWEANNLQSTVIRNVGVLPNDHCVALHDDSQACIKIAGNPQLAERTKHFDIKYHWLREKEKAKQVKLTYVNTNEQLADIFTKPLGAMQHHYLRGKLTGYR